MPQRNRVKSIINANIAVNVVREINEIFKNTPHTDSTGHTISKSAVIELILKKGLQHKNEIKQELQNR